MGSVIKFKQKYLFLISFIKVQAWVQVPKLEQPFFKLSTKKNNMLAM